MSTVVKFVPFSSLVDTSFWHHLADLKLNKLKLDDKPITATASYSNSLAPGLPPLVSFDYSSFRTGCKVDGNHLLNGDIFITNTIEEFKNIDKQKLLNENGYKIFESIKSGEVDVEKDLSRFLLLTYLDLKKFHFYYWFAFPALTWPKVISSELNLISEVWSEVQVSSLLSQINDSTPIALVELKKHEVLIYSLTNYAELHKGENEIYVIFPDASKSNDLGWSLRNVLTFLSHQHKNSTWNIIGLRKNGTSIDNSLCGKLIVDLEMKDPPSTVGWERNENGQMAPRKVDLSSILDPEKLAQNAVSLNLKLMRWRLVPEINLEKIADAKCLLLGAGTLGCHVARSLMSWGVTNITFVDNSKVSYSNPVRQTLYEFGDCLSGGKMKAVAAADTLKRIYPKINALGYNLSIPMPGHSVNEQNLDKIKQTVVQLDELIKNSDCIYLLMDTRESRWLPTLLSQIHGKLVVNAALGFDTFLVQRHGLPEKSESTSSSCDREIIPGYQLGCYFCNDVVAPGNSTRDRTLDQQCTVTRPGVSMIASALAVELMVSVMQHPLGINAPAIVGTGGNAEETESCLGIVPHQIRGFLSQFQQVLPSTSSFTSCTACSKPIIEEYRKRGIDFLIDAFNNSSFLEETSGLTQLHAESNLQEIWELSDDESSIHE